jgi:hypothetical protein
MDREQSRPPEELSAMPIRDRVSRRALPGEDELRRELEEEIRHPKPQGQPVIIVERPHPSTIHLYAVWDKFQGLEQTVRSRIVLDAYEAAAGQAEALKVTVSMGLTTDEATRMGIDFEPEP